MKGLPTSAVYDIVMDTGPILHVNFMDRLPPEVCLKVLGFLDPVSVVQMAQASRGCMSLSMDWTLWQQLYFREGWLTNLAELRSFEKEMSDEIAEVKRIYRSPQAISRKQSASKDRVPPRKQLKTRATNSPELYARDQDDDLEMVDVSARSHSYQTSIFGGLAPQASRNLKLDGGTSPSETPATQRIFGPSHENRPPQTQPSVRWESANPATTVAPSDIASMSSLLVLDRRENKRKLNWQYLYTQRRRLEANWEAEKYVNFQLPHPDYPKEAHKECIYTIQHCGKYLVSGSRDRTLRVWNLDTKRLILPPLEGHSGSVLCLQFDPDPTEDIIVSGSSDATVRIWRFSTGKLLQVLRKAHRESVLNVRFDRRILVTCSKDKTIKIFNRRAMHPGEVGYPGMPQAVQPASTVLNNFGFNPSPYEGLSVKPPYTLIGCLEGHGAAVNAVQIYKNEIVSASGDRNVKVWDWPLQTCIRTLVGHQKGIACVQYDGRRIVSGSSDNEVKVFDKETGLEVASLRGHTSLVRTVQAGFGDCPGSVEDDQAAARNVDNDYFKAVDSGAIPRFKPKTRIRNAGSRRPEDIMAYGAKLPPGGGGGRYGRIVSGSYDETIIIWRRDKEGVWKAQHTLRQADAARSALIDFEASRPPVLPPNGMPPIPNHTPGTPSYFHALIDHIVPLGPNALRQTIYQYPQLIQFNRLQSAIMAEPVEATRQQLRAIVAHAVQRHQAALMQYQSLHPQNLQNGHSVSHSTAMMATGGLLNNAQDHGAATPFAQMQGIHEATSQPQPSSSQAQATPQHLTHIQPQHHQTSDNGQADNGPDTQHTTQSTVPPNSQPHASSNFPQTPSSSVPQNAQVAAQAAQTQAAQAQAFQAQIAQSQAQAQLQAQIQAAQIQAQAHQAAQQNALQQGSMARVFKLQFDARRIICCSQTPIIVGWDFANGDKRIEEASRFFGVVE